MSDDPICSVNGPRMSADGVEAANRPIPPDRFVVVDNLGPATMYSDADTAASVAHLNPGCRVARYVFAEFVVEDQS